MFIGRERELDALNKLYKSNKFELEIHNFTGVYRTS